MSCIFVLCCVLFSCVRLSTNHSARYKAQGSTAEFPCSLWPVQRHLNEVVMTAIRRTLQLSATAILQLTSAGAKKSSEKVAEKHSKQLQETSANQLATCLVNNSRQLANSLERLEQLKAATMSHVRPLVRPRLAEIVEQHRATSEQSRR